MRYVRYLRGITGENLEISEWGAPGASKAPTSVISLYELFRYKC